MMQKLNKNDLKEGNYFLNCFYLLFKLYLLSFYLNFYRQAATKKQLEQLRSEDVSFESLLEGNDSIFTNNLQDPLALGDIDKRASDKTKPGIIINHHF